MKIFVKLALILSSLVLIQPKTFAFEDYMVFSRIPIDKVTVKNKKVLDVNIVNTIYNERKILTIEPLSKGKSGVILQSGDSEFLFFITVKNKKTLIESSAPYFELYPIDRQPLYLEIDPPPELKTWTN